MSSKNSRGNVEGYNSINNSNNNNNKITGAEASSKRNISSGSRTNNICGHGSLVMHAIISAADLPPLQCRDIHNVEVDICLRSLEAAAEMPNIYGRRNKAQAITVEVMSKETTTTTTARTTTIKNNRSGNSK